MMGTTLSTMRPATPVERIRDESLSNRVGLMTQALSDDGNGSFDIETAETDDDEDNEDEEEKGKEKKENAEVSVISSFDSLEERSTSLYRKTTTRHERRSNVGNIIREINGDVEAEQRYRTLQGNNQALTNSDRIISRKRTRDNSQTLKHENNRDGKSFINECVGRIMKIGTELDILHKSVVNGGWSVAAIELLHASEHSQSTKRLKLQKLLMLREQGKFGSFYRSLQHYSTRDSLDVDRFTHFEIQLSSRMCHARVPWSLYARSSGSVMQEIMHARQQWRRSDLHFVSSDATNPQMPATSIIDVRLHPSAPQVLAGCSAGYKNHSLSVGSVFCLDLAKPIDGTLQVGRKRKLIQSVGHTANTRDICYTRFNHVTRAVACFDDATVASWDVDSFEERLEEGHGVQIADNIVDPLFGNLDMQNRREEVSANRVLSDPSIEDNVIILLGKPGVWRHNKILQWCTSKDCEINEISKGIDGARQEFLSGCIIGQRVVVGCGNSDINLFDIGRSTLLRKWSPFHAWSCNDMDRGVDFVCKFGMEVFLSVSAERIAHHDMRVSWNSTKIICQSDYTINEAIISSCGNLMAVSNTGNQVNVFDCRNFRTALYKLSLGEPAPILDNVESHQRDIRPRYANRGDEGVNSMCFLHQNRSTLVCGSGNGNIGIFDLSLGDPKLSLQNGTHLRCVNGVAASLYNGKDFFVSCSDDTAVGIYDGGEQYNSLR